MRKILSALMVIGMSFIFCACPLGGLKNFSVGGTVSGLLSGNSIVLQNNGASNLTITGNGGYSFGTMAANSAYAVTILTQPTSQTCTVSNGSGTMGTANVSNINIACTLPVGGTVSGLLSGNSVVLQDNSADNKTITANGSYTFATSIASNAAYSVTVLTQPTGQTCTVSNGTGTMGAAPVTNVSVTCTTNTYTVGGTVTGLLSGRSLVLQNNLTNNTTVSYSASQSSVPYAFSTPIAYQAAYSVTVTTQPDGMYCFVSSGTASGTMGTSNITNINLTCALSNFVYLLYRDNGTHFGHVNQYVMGPDGGLLPLTPASLPLGDWVNTGFDPGGSAVTPDNKFLYVINAGDGSIAGFSINSLTGTLTALTGSPFQVSVNDTVPHISPDGKFLYAKLTNSTFGQYPINSDGTLGQPAVITARSGSGAFVNWLAVSQDSQTLYVNMQNRILQYSVSASSTTPYLPSLTATLTPASGTPPGKPLYPWYLPWDMYVSGNYLYALNLDDLSGHGPSSIIERFSIGGTGTLTQLLPDSLTAGAFDGAASMCISPLLRTSLMYSTSGIIKYMSTRILPVVLLLIQMRQVWPSRSHSIVLSPLMKASVLVNDGGTEVVIYTLNADGTLTPRNTSTTVALDNPAGMSIVKLGQRR